MGKPTQRAVGSNPVLKPIKAGVSEETGFDVTVFTPSDDPG